MIFDDAHIPRAAQGFLGGFLQAHGAHTSAITCRPGRSGRLQSAAACDAGRPQSAMQSCVVKGKGAKKTIESVSMLILLSCVSTPYIFDQLSISRRLQVTVLSTP